MTARLAAAVVGLSWAGIAQTSPWSYRGFLENRTFYYPRATETDSAHWVNETLLRFEGSVRLRDGFSVAAGVDAQTDSNNQVDRAWHFSWEDRSLRRPPLALRTFQLRYAHGPFRIEAGKQVLHWGVMDFSSPTDKLAPREYLNPSSADFLAAFAVRAVADTGPHSLEVVYLPRFTPSRIPLERRRWLILPDEFASYEYHSTGVSYPGGPQFGARYHRIASPYEYSFCFFEGFKNLPTLLYDKDEVHKQLTYQMLYPKMRMVGADFTWPWRNLLWKTESTYVIAASPYLSSTWTYALQAEKVRDKWQLVLGFSGDLRTTERRFTTWDLDRAARQSVSGHVAWNPSPKHTLTGEWFLHPNAKAFVTRILYSRNFRAGFRASAGWIWIGGSDSDPLARYRVDSYLTLQFRYSF